MKTSTFVKLVQGVTKKELREAEYICLSLLNFNTVVKPSLYAKYYFELRQLHAEVSHNDYYIKYNIIYIIYIYHVFLMRVTFDICDSLFMCISHFLYLFFITILSLTPPSPHLSTLFVHMSPYQTYGTACQWCDKPLTAELAYKLEQRTSRTVKGKLRSSGSSEYKTMTLEDITFRHTSRFILS